jgi:hypothetical protein
MHPLISKGVERIREELQPFSVKVKAQYPIVLFSKEGKVFELFLLGDHPSETGGRTAIFEGLIAHSPEKVAALALSKLGLNKVVFARKCQIKKVPKKEAKEFCDQHHLMDYAQSATHLGLYFKDELLALATFSKGRKMRRLPEDKRSYELVRFCSKGGVTVAGGLTRLIKNFCEEKTPGDIMTYVDRQFSDGANYLKVGFKKAGTTPPHFFIVDRNSLVICPINLNKATNQTEYLLENLGNQKLIYVS